MTYILLYLCVRFIGVSMLFDMIIGNPPYNVCDKSKTNINLMITYKYNEYKLQLYALFLELSYNLTRNNGLINILIPNTYYLNKYKHKLRRFLVQKTSIINLVEFGQVFKNICVFVSSLLLKKQIPFIDHCIKLLSYDYIQNKLVFNAHIHQDDWDNQTNYFQFSNTLAFNKNQYLNLGDVCEIYLGIQIINRNESLKLEYIQGWKPLIHGGSIHRYYTNKDFDYFCFDKKYCKSGGKESVYNTMTLVIPQCRNVLLGSIRNAGIFMSNTAFSVFTKSNLNYTPFFLLGIINSRFLGWYWKCVLSEKKDVFPKLNKNQLAQLPIPILTGIKQDISKKVAFYAEKVFSIKSKNPNVDTSLLERNIDLLVYELYDLKPKDIHKIESLYTIGE